MIRIIMTSFQAAAGKPPESAFTGKPWSQKLGTRDFLRAMRMPIRVLRSKVRGLEQQPSLASGFGAAADSALPFCFIFQLMTSHSGPAVSCSHCLHGLLSHTHLLGVLAAVTWLTGLS